MKLWLFLLLSTAVFAQQDFRIARLKYSGGGDWYNDPSAEVNLLKFAQQAAGLKVKAEYTFVELASDDIFSYPFLFMTGHGNVVFNESEAKRLRLYLESGGFLYVDDDYGLDEPFRRELKKVFPEIPLIELPFSHPIYTVLYSFPFGPPKTHKHDEKTPQGFGIILNGRVALYYTFESNPSDGWTDADVYKDPPEKREEALRFGTNLLLYALTY